jgi:hypothetical protein
MCKIKYFEASSENLHIALKEDVLK